MGGIEPARALILQAIGNRKSIVTANKALLASHGADLFAAAYTQGEDIYYEAAVAGAIPIIRPMRDSLAGDHVVRLMGIVNGTTNYILTKMHEDNREFADVLAEAQKLGYAEADPTADVEGLMLLLRLRFYLALLSIPVSQLRMYTAKAFLRSR